MEIKEDTIGNNKEEKDQHNLHRHSNKGMQNIKHAVWG